MNGADNGVNKKVVLLVTTMSSFLTPFMGSSVNIGLPSIGNEFAMNAILLSWVSTAYYLAAAVFLVPLGRIADMRGMKKMFLYGISLDLAASLLIVVSNNEIELIALRVLQGIGGAMIFGTGVAILTSAYPARERGKALGINVAGTYTGLSLGPVVSGFLTQYFGWRSIFLSYVPLEFIIITLTLWKLKGEWAEAEGEGFDFTGSVIYGLALVAVMYGFSSLPDTSGALLVLIGVLCILVFVAWETKAKCPVLNISLFRHNPAFTFSNLAALINYSATNAMAFLMSLYLQYIKALSPQDAGLIMVSQPIVMAVFSPFAGRLSDRIEPRIVASTGMAITVAGLFLFTLLNETSTLGFIIACLIIVGFGFALFSSPNTNAIMSSVEKKFYGVASGMVGTMRLIGQMLSMGIAMLVLAVYMGRVQIMPENYPLFMESMKITFMLFALLCFAGIFASLARGKVR